MVQLRELVRCPWGEMGAHTGDRDVGQPVLEGSSPFPDVWVGYNWVNVKV